MIHLLTCARRMVQKGFALVLHVELSCNKRESKRYVRYLNVQPDASVTNDLHYQRCLNRPRWRSHILLFDLEELHISFFFFYHPQQVQCWIWFLSCLSSNVRMLIFVLVPHSRQLKFWSQNQDQLIQAAFGRCRRTTLQLYHTEKILANCNCLKDHDMRRH